MRKFSCYAEKHVRGSEGLIRYRIKEKAEENMAGSGAGQYDCGCIFAYQGALGSAFNYMTPENPVECKIIQDITISLFTEILISPENKCCMQKQLFEISRKTARLISCENFFYKGTAL